MSTNPYAPPKAAVADIEIREDSPPLWNPNAAANWSLLFSPAFGAFLNMKNWQALGEPAKASAARIWFISVLSILIVLPLLIVSVPGLREWNGFPNLVGLTALISWYVRSGRPQAQYVKQHFGKDYPRRGWGKPLLIGFAAILGYVLLWAILGGILAAVGVVVN